MSELPRAPTSDRSFASADSIFSPRFISAKSGARLRIATFDPAAHTDAQRVCVLLNGQTEFIEKYFEVIDELRTRGFTVVTMDWRGQGGSERALENQIKCYVKDFREYDDDLASLMDQVVSPLGKRPPIGLAHSMGGHNLLRTLHARPNALACAVLSAPMIGVSARGTPTWLARIATRLQIAGGNSTSWVWGMDKRDPLTMSFADQIVTSDRARFKRSQDFLVEHPDLRLAGPTWGWLEAAFQSMSSMNAGGYPEAITTPVLICGAGRDRIVLTDSERAFARRMPRGKFVEFEDAEHEILMENDSIRARFWTAFDEFVGANSG